MRQRLTAAATAVGTLTITLLLLAGMPYALWRATGVPWPEHVSSWSQLGHRLAEPISDPLLVDLLAVVGWVCWAAFACTVVREIIWYGVRLPELLRDRRIHHDHLVALSVKGSLAALCIGTFVVAVLALWHPQSITVVQRVGPEVEARPSVAMTAPLLPVALRQTNPQAAALTTLGQSTSTTRFDPTYAGARGRTAGFRQIEYTVVEGDTLWDIAQTHMGDALRWPRIYALNKERIQSDGARLSDPNLITPGWQLTIPTAQHATPPPTSTPKAADLTPDPTRTRPSETAPARSTPTPHQNHDTTHQEQGDRTTRESGPKGEAASGKPDIESDPAAIGFGEASLIGLTTAAGLLVARRYWYRHRNRVDETAPEEEPTALSPLVDQAAHAATWHRPSEDLDALVISRRTPPRKPHDAGMVTIGTCEGAEVPLNELAVPGGCTWAGPGAEDAARALLVGVLTAAERQRPEPPSVRAVVPQEMADVLLPGLPAKFSALTQSAGLGQAIQAAEQHLIAVARAQDEQDTARSVIQPTGTDSAPQTEPGTLVLLTVPDAAHTGQLQTLATHSHPGKLIVLTLGTPLPDGQMWHIADDGTTTRPTTAGRHPGPLQLFHLTHAAAQDVTEVLLTAHGHVPVFGPRQEPRPDNHATTGRHAASGQPKTLAVPTARNTSARPHPAEASRPDQTKPVRLHVLGPISLYARGHQDPIGTSLRTEVHEFLALLAAHPAGLLASDIAEKLNLDPERDQNALKNLRRAVRRTLRAATGITAQEFILRHGELHKLNADLVETDLADFTRILKESCSGSAEKEERTEALRAVRNAVHHYRGPFAHGSEYLWADTIRVHLATQATDAALRLARQAEQAGTSPQEQDTVLALLEKLSTIHPDHERLAQHTIRLYQAAGRHDAARHTYTRLKRHLTDLGLEPEPATQVLVTPSNHTGASR